MDRLDVQQIGRYRLLDVIGKGGMGIVYRAIDTIIGRKVAIKMLLGEGDQRDNDLLARFYREVRSTANLQHKNIVTVYALDDFDGLPYMVMEYLEGQSIAQIIASRQPLSIIEKIGLICQVCEGLQFAHERDVIHRDVKPANILVLTDGIAKIVDFGIARVGRNDNLTRTGQIVGSVYYMSPEQTSGVVDRRSDIYSTGVSLFEFLTGEVPFKGPDTQSTLLKIVQDPIPPLSKYLPAYPKALDAILGKATAKNAEDRYQTAEDLGYDLAQLHDSLKREMTDEFLTQAKEAIDARNWDIARQRLQEVLRFDRRNQAANELYREVREQIQLQQRSQQIEQLKSQAQLALGGLQYEEALECIEQAKRLAPDDEELDKISRSIKSQLERARELSEALRRGQAALYAGDLSEAGQAVDRALEIDNSNTEARALDTLVRKEFEDRSKRAKLQGLLDEARREISARNFLSALQSLEKAQSIDPADSNIRELLTWAASGHEQEKQRTELRRCTDEIGRMVAEDRYSEALVASEAALQEFPNDVPLTKLYELSKRQLEVLERRRIIDEVSVAARSLVDSRKTADAIRLLESGLQRFQADPNLEMLLEITRAQADSDRNEEEERERQVRNLIFDPTSPSSSSGGKDSKTVNDILLALESALSRRLALSRLEALALQLSEASKRASLTSAQSQRIDSVLAQVSSCGKVQEDARAELNELGRLMREARDISEVDSALDRARFILGQHPKDDIVRQDFDKIRNVADEVRAQREAVRVQISDRLRSMQSSQSITEIEKNREVIRQLSGFWAKDDLIRNLLDQVSACVNEALERRSTVLNELAQLADSVSAARSCGQLRFLKEQVKIPLSELDDSEVSLKAAEVEGAAIRRIHEIEKAVSHLTDLNAKASDAESIAELKHIEQQAIELIHGGLEVEETIDLRQRIQRTLEERTREYRRIRTSLEQLVSNSKSAGRAELDAILARRRILIQKFPTEACFGELQLELETAVAERTKYLTEVASSEQQMLAEDLGEVSIEESDTAAMRASRLKDQAQAASSQAERPRRRRFPLSLTLLAGGLLAPVGAALFLVSKTVRIRIDPPAAKIQLDGRICESPCSRRLTPGRHELVATLPGFDEIHRIVTVSWGLGDLPALALRLTPETTPATGPKLTTGGRIVVQANVEGADVLVDGRLVGVTESDHRFVISGVVSGDHLVTAQKQGYVSTMPLEVKVMENQQAELSLNLVAEQRPTKIATEQYLVVQSLSGAQVSVDQIAPASIPPSGQLFVKVEPGIHRVEVKKEGFEVWQYQVEVQPGARKPVSAELKASVKPQQQNPEPHNFAVVVAPRASFMVTQENIEKGQSTELKWETSDATEVTIDGEKAATRGTLKISPSESRNYLLVARGPGGEASHEVHVEVKSPPPPPTKLDEGVGIAQLLDAYVVAFQAKDRVALRHIWPTMTDKNFKDIQGTFKDAESIRISLHENGPAQLSGSSGIVSCIQKTEIRAGGVTQSFSNGATFYLRRLGSGNNGDWVIERINYTKTSAFH